MRPRAIETEVKFSGGFQTPARESVDILHGVKTNLLEHLDKENRELYPTLQAAAASDPSLRSLLSSFGKEMEQIVPQALEFFARYDDPDAVTKRIKSDVQYAVQFGADLERFTGLLGLRIGREERTLYPQYDRVNSKKVA
ncbi:MAG: hemerythrin domain-containing protein [Nitrospira sp.]